MVSGDPQRQHDLADRLAQVADPGSSQAVGAAAAFLLTVYVGLTLAYRDAIPLFEAPDEPAHLQYAAYLYEHHRLPYRDVLGAGAQPPLVYAIAAPLLANTGLDVALAEREIGRAMTQFYVHSEAEGGGAAIAALPRGHREFATDGSLAPLHALRSTSLVFGLLTVILTFAAAWRLSRDARFSLLAGALVAFNPQFLFSSGSFSNDPAAAAVGAFALWIVVRAFEDPDGPGHRHYIGAAILITAGALIKVATLPGILATAFTLIAVDQREGKQVWRDAGIAAALALGVAGSYWIWSIERHGLAPSTNAFVASAIGMAGADRIHMLAYLAVPYWDHTFESFWARFGWFNVTVARPAQLAFFAITWTGLLGWLAGRRRRLPEEALRTPALRNYLFAAVGATLAAHLVVNAVTVNCQGRLLFACIAQIAFLLALGMVRLIGNAERMLSLTLVVVMALLVLDVYCLRGVLVPAYR
jgi:hypothetical protein